MRYILTFIFLCVSQTVYADRLKDMTTIAGVRPNQLVGYGVVAGLAGTGDGGVRLTLQTIQSLVAQFGQSIDMAGINAKNAAIVMVTAELPPFAKPGQTLDVTISTMGIAKSIRGGTLLMTPLLGADGETYAIAQGNLLVGGLGVNAKDGSQLMINQLTVGRIPHGATVERIVDTPFLANPYFVLNLNQPDFSTANRIATEINRVFEDEIAVPLDATSVRVDAPEAAEEKVSFMSLIENIEILPARPSARVVINARTGTIVIGGDVRVTPAVVTHGALTVRVNENLAALPRDQVVTEDGQAVIAPAGADVVPNSEIITDDEARAFVFAPGTDLASIVNSINAIGVSAADLVAILEALRQAGALRADLVII